MNKYFKVYATIFTFFFIAIFILTLLNAKNLSTQNSNIKEQWLPFKSEELKFSTQIPSTWQIYKFPQKGAVFFGSNIYIYRQNIENKEDFYNISVQRISLKDKILEDFYFPQNVFGKDRSKLLKKEVKGNYTIYRAEDLGTQDNLMSVFITKDNEFFLRYSIAPYLKDSPSGPQNKVIEYFDKIVDATILL